MIGRQTYSMLALALFFSQACGEPSAKAPLQPWGQWVWSDADVRVFEQSRAKLPDLQAAVWIATIEGCADGRLSADLGFSPSKVASPALLVRLDDDFSVCWNLSDAEVLAAVDEKLGRLLAMADQAGVHATEIQLDYDSPTSKLPRWATLLAGLRQRSLKGKNVWITSLVAHLQEPSYGDYFRDTVDGHMIQVFDTGDRVGTAADIRKTLDRAAMPFRLGLGAFERQNHGVAVTEHGRWFSESGPITQSEWYRGTWVFPAGRPWIERLEDK